MPKRISVTLRVDPDLALIDDAPLVVMENFDGILNRDDVPIASAVDVVDHRGKRSGLSGAGGSCDQNQTTGFIGKSAHYGR
jgi:hypothetical protein